MSKYKLLYLARQLVLRPMQCIYNSQEHFQKNSMQELRSKIATTANDRVLVSSPDHSLFDQINDIVRGELNMEREGVPEYFCNEEVCT